MQKSITDRINERLRQLEAKATQPVATPGEDYTLRNPRELTCMAFGGNIGEEMFPFIQADPAWREHTQALWHTTKQVCEALRDCLDDMSEANQQRVKDSRYEDAMSHLRACFWLGDKMKAIRLQEAWRIRDRQSPPMSADLWGA